MQSTDQPPPTLRAVQQWIAARIVQPEPTESETPAWLIAQPPHGTLRERLGVYVAGYPARVQEAIEECFPAVAHVIGHTATHGLVERYVQALTRHSYNLNDVGADLPRFLRGDTLATRFPFLPDLARLEWAVSSAFHAHDQAPLDPAPLARWSEEQWQRATLRFQPSVALVCSPWPIGDLWRARDIPREEINLDLRDRADQVRVWRAGFAVRCASISRDEALLLATLLAEQPLGKAIERLGEGGGDPAAVSAWFSEWVQQGLIVACESDLTQ